MNITFMIGNGFDLRVGLKTSFCDMYDEYTALASASENIKNFKQMLKNDAPNYETWGDFEMAMAQKVNEFETEEAFIECLRDFKSHLAVHLTHEQNMFKEKLQKYPAEHKQCVEEVKNSLGSFYKGLTPNVVNQIEMLNDSEDHTYQFLSFNYTSTIDRLILPYMGEVLHVHGSLEEGAAVGIDNLGQIKNLLFKPTKKFLRAFIKPDFNENYNSDRLRKVENAIDNSNVICVYGMSLGLSDLSWAIKLRNWLLSDEDHHLVYFVHDERKFNKFNWDEIMDEEEDRIASLLGKLCDNSADMDNIFNQVHVPVGYDIFDIADILEKAEIENARRQVIRQAVQERPKELATGLV